MGEYPQGEERAKTSFHIGPAGTIQIVFGTVADDLDRVAEIFALQQAGQTAVLACGAGCDGGALSQLHLTGQPQVGGDEAGMAAEGEELVGLVVVLALGAIPAPIIWQE